MNQREVMDLNGWWHIWYDEAADWRSEVPLPPRTPLSLIPRRTPSTGWRQMDQGLESLPVPGTWALSRPGYHGVAWQWRPLVVPEEWQDRVVRLRFEGVRLRAEVYLDEELVGYDLEGLTPFEIDLTGHVKPGRQQELALRVTNPGGSTCAKDAVPILWAGVELPTSHDWGGIWGAVSLIATAHEYISDIVALPATDLQSVALRVSFVHRGTCQRARLLAHVYDQESNLVAESTLPDVALGHDKEVVVLTLAMPSPRPWSRRDPHLYTAKVTLLADGYADSVSVSFGLRCWQVRGSRFYLNDEPVFLRSAISYGWYPETLAYPSRRLAGQEVHSALSMGLNALTIRGQPPTPALLDAADSGGLMICGELGGFAGPNEESLPANKARGNAQMVWERMRRLLRRDHNHPSLVWWHLIGDTGVPLCSDGGQFQGPCLLDLARSEDPTRLLTLASGASHMMACNPYDSQVFPVYSRYVACQEHPSPPFSLEQGIRDLQSPEEGAPFLIGAAPCFTGLPDIPAVVRHYGDRVLHGSDAEHWRRWKDALETDFRLYRLDRTFVDVSSFCRATHMPQSCAVSRLIENQRLHPACSGGVIEGWSSSFHSGPHGLVDPFRNPQADAPRIARSCAPLALTCEGLPAQIHSGQRCPVQVGVLNEHGVQERATLRWQFRAFGGRVAGQGTVDGWLSGTSSQVPWAQIVLSPAVTDAEEVGPWILSMVLQGQRRPLCSKDLGLWVSCFPVEHAGDIQVLDEAGCLAQLRQDWGVTWANYVTGEPVRHLLVVGCDDAQIHAVLHRARTRQSRLAILIDQPEHRLSRAMELIHSLSQEVVPQIVPLHYGHAVHCVYGHAHPLLQGVALPGVWGHLQEGLFPRFLVRGLGGDALVGGCAWDHKCGLGVPSLGLALGILPWGASELLLCTLGLRQGRSGAVGDPYLPCGEQLLHNIAWWLRGVH